MHNLPPDDWEGRAAWLKDQAALVYRFNPELDYWEVRRRYHFETDPPFIPTPLTERLKDSFQFAATWYQRQPSLLHMTPEGLQPHRTIRMWSRLPEETQVRISDFFSDHGLHNFDFFDHGGWGLIFKAQDRETGRNRIARIGSDSTKDRWRPSHRGTLPLFADNYNDLQVYNDLKLEIMPEVGPLHKLPARPSQRSALFQVFHDAVRVIGWGTNIIYPDDLNDDDCEYHNVGVLPDGRVLGFDPMFCVGDLARKRKAEYRFTSEHLAIADRLYGMAPDARFF